MQVNFCGRESVYHTRLFRSVHMLRYIDWKIDHEFGQEYVYFISVCIFFKVPPKRSDKVTIYTQPSVGRKSVFFNFYLFINLDPISNANICHVLLKMATNR